MKKTLIYSAVALTLSACGGGGGGSSSESVLPSETNATADGTSTAGNTPTGDTGNTAGGATTAISQVGIVNADIFEELVEFDATFFSFPQQLPLADLLEEFTPAADSCDVSGFSLPSIDELDLPGDLESLTPDLLSAGEVLTISSPAGSYAELLRNEQFGFVFYETDEDIVLSAPLPSGLSINIPGEQFPAFGDVSFPVADPLTVNSPAASEQITSGTTFSWVPSGNPDSFIEIDAFAFSADFSQTTSIYCTVIDDGSFSFPSATQSEMGSFSGSGDIARVSIKIEQNGNALLLLSSSAER